MKLRIEYDVDLKDEDLDLYSEIVQFSLHDWVGCSHVLWKRDGEGEYVLPPRCIAVLKLAYAGIVEE